jgi:hypothetical protein
MQSDRCYFDDGRKHYNFFDRYLQVKIIKYLDCDDDGMFHY